MRYTCVSFVIVALLSAPAAAHVLDTSSHRVERDVAAVRSNALAVITSGPDGRVALETALRTQFGGAVVARQSQIANVLLLDAAPELLASAKLRDLISRLSADGSVRFVSQVYDGPSGETLLDTPDIAVSPAPGMNEARMRTALAAETSQPVLARSVFGEGALVVRTKQITREAATATAAQLSMLAEVGSARVLKLQLPPAEAVFIEPTTGNKVAIRGAMQSLDGSMLTRPMCGSDTTNVTPEMLREIAEESKRLAAGAENTLRLSSSSGVNGFDLVFNLVGSFTDEQIAAIRAIERLFENRFSDPKTVEIQVRFAALGPGVLGATSTNRFVDNYFNIRDGLQFDADDDGLLDFLPAGGSVPVRFTGNDASTNASQILFTQAVLSALGGFPTGNAAFITFNTQFSFDFTPPTNPSLTDFRSVFAHEIGHAMGFTSAADFFPNEMEVLDLFRFQRSDGSFDHNPDTLAEFQTTPRLVTQNAPGTNDDVNSDIIDAEFRMSDGNPRQASHFSEGFPGLMDPTLASGQTFAPDYLQEADRIMFDLIGWDDADCNGNDIPDEVEIDDGLVDDLDGNRVPDECECFVAAAPIATLGSNTPLNRYIAIRANNPGESVAIRVTFDSFHQPDDPVAGTPDFSALDGQQLWAGPPQEFMEASNPDETFFASLLQCEPHFQDWSAFDTVYLYGESVVPSTDMSVQTASISCELRLDNEASYSLATPIRTAEWGDTEVPFAADTPVNQPDLADILMVVDKLLGQLPPLKAQTQLQPNLPRVDQRVDISDVLAAVDAFLGQPYPFAGPVPCP